MYYVSHLEQVPQTGRWRFMNTSPKTEAAVGEAARQEIYAQFRGQILHPNHPVSRHVRRVASRILHASNLGTIHGEERLQPSFASDEFGGFGFGGFSAPDSSLGASTHPSESYGPEKQWDVIVIDNKTVNAMAVSGAVVVFTGILPVCQDEEGLAAVLGHEIGHVVARHPAEQISSKTVQLLLSAFLQLLGVDPIWANTGTVYGVELRNSRAAEYEADLIGLRLMSRACYNPGAAPRMFERLGMLEKSVATRATFEFAQTHPASENRVKYLEEALPEAYQIAASNPECARVRDQLDAFRSSAHSIKLQDIASMRPF